MTNFIMTALTVDGNNWVPYSILDAPVCVEPNILSLMNLPGSPLLLLDTTRRGDRDTNLFEGDIIEKDNEPWMICYERGFYAINGTYCVRPITDFISCAKLGVVDFDCDFPVPLNIKRRLLFKSGTRIFRIEGVNGFYEGKLIINPIAQMVSPENVHQDCGCSLGSQRLYLGDKTEYGTVVCEYGVIGFKNGSQFTSLQKVRDLDGCS